jgi:hypothetical protein
MECFVVDPEAQLMAYAINSSLGDIHNKSDGGFAKDIPRNEWDQVNVLQYWAGRREELEDLAAFCEKGEFDVLLDGAPG